MINEIQNLLDKYLDWLKDKTVLKSINDWVEITTPYVDRHNDFIQIYVKKDSPGNFILSDDGYTISDLESTGCKLDSPKRKNLLNMTLNGYGIKLEENALLTSATNSTFALKKHNLIQSILAVNDLFFLAAPFVYSIFLEDVTMFLDTHEVRYTPKIKFTGKSGYDHLFDFVIPKSNKKPERILKAINRPTKEQAESFLFAWLDTRDTRSKESSAFVFLHDRDYSPANSVISSFENYNVNSILWSQRNNFADELAA